MIVPAQKEPGSNDDHASVNNREYWAFVQNSFSGNETGIKNCPDDGPNQKEPAHNCASAAAPVVGVRADDIAPIGESRHHRDHGSPAEPPQCPRHQAGDDLAFSRRVQFLHERHVDQVEEV